MERVLYGLQLCTAVLACTQGRCDLELEHRGWMSTSVTVVLHF